MQLSEIIHVLILRLSKRDMEPGLIPGFMKSLMNVLGDNPYLGLGQVNSRLRYLGWDGTELDYHTLQLAITCFEAGGLPQLGEISARWAEGGRQAA